MRSTILICTASLALSSACGKDGETGDPDDTGGDTHDTVPEALADSYDHVNLIHLSPNEVGLQFGLTECDIELGATLTVDSTGTACPTCDALYSGALTYTYTDCSGVSFDGDSLSYGLTLEGQHIRVSTFDDESGQWSDEGLAAPQGGGLYELLFTELIGDKSFNLGESTLTYRFTAL